MRCLGLLLAFAVSAAPSLAQPRDATARCRKACLRHVTAPRLRASACGACVLAPGDAAAWLSRLPERPPGLLDDPDWQVRWAALLASARQKQGTAPRELGAWLATARGEARLRACQTALHAAGALSLTLEALLEPERSGLPAGAPRCAALVPALLEAERPRLYALDPAEQNEALRHPAQALGLSPARLTLDAMAPRSPGLDDAALEPLLRWAALEDTSAAAALTAAATPADVAVMNRVLAVASRRRDAARPALSHADAVTRKRAVLGLASFAPWFEAELLAALDDAAPAVRLAAARGLAQGEGRKLGPAVAARLDGSRPASPTQQAALLALLQDTSDPACADVALATWRAPARAPALRAQALAVAAACRFEAAADDVEAALRSPALFERAAAVRALGFAPRDEARRAALLRALEAPEPEVRAAACGAAGQQRWRPLAAAVQARAADDDAAVRAAALEALAALEAPGAEATLCTALGRDPNAGVRAAAARQLTRFAGPRVHSALRAAAQGDEDPDVKLVAAETLRRLGAGSPTP